MSDKIEYSGDELLSVTNLSIVARMDRRTVAKRMKECPQDGTYKGHKAWKLSTAGPCLWGDEADYDVNGDGPKNPQDRRAYFEAEKSRLDVEERVRNLIPVDEVRTELGRAFKSVDLGLSKLGDDVERQVGLTPEQIAAVNRCVDQMRLALVSELQSG